MKSMNKKNCVLKGKHGKPIVADIYIKNVEEKKPVVIFCHGYKGFKDWGSWELTAEAFANAGFCFIKFNFSHNGGTIEEPIDFPDLEAFGHNNYIKELDDLEIVIDWVTHTNFEFAKLIDLKKTAIIGHSRGGGIVTIKANEDARVTHVISWAGVSNYAVRFGSAEKIAQWKKEGIMYVQNGRTKQQMPHYYQFFENFKENETRLTIKNAVSNLKIPYLIVHGDTDETVALNNAKDLQNWYSESELFVVKNANHVFGGKHPWDQKELPEQLALIVEKSIDFIKNN